MLQATIEPSDDMKTLSLHVKATTPEEYIALSMFFACSHQPIAMDLYCETRTLTIKATDANNQPAKMPYVKPTEPASKETHVPALKRRAREKAPVEPAAVPAVTPSTPVPAASAAQAPAPAPEAPTAEIRQYLGPILNVVGYADYSKAIGQENDWYYSSDKGVVETLTKAFMEKKHVAIESVEKNDKLVIISIELIKT